MREFKTHVESKMQSCETQEVDGPTLDLLHSAIGVAGEVGELVDAVKKAVFYRQRLDEDNVIEEIGDILFYLQAMANTIGFSLGDCMDANTDKLNVRYPDGYSDEHAKTRFDKMIDSYLDSAYSPD